MKSIHEAAIAILKRDYPDLRTKGFRRALSALEILASRHASPCYGDDLKTYSRNGVAPDHAFPATWENHRYLECQPTCRRIPDGYFLDFYNQMVVVFEVEDANKMDVAKLGDYYDLYDEFLDELGWGISLISVSRWGKKTPVPIFDYIFAGINEEVPEDSFLGVLKHCMTTEFSHSVLACSPRADWDLGLMAEELAPARDNLRISQDFWREPRATKAHEAIIKESDHAGRDLTLKHRREYERWDEIAAVG